MQRGLGSVTALGRSLGLLSAPGQPNIANPPEQRVSRIFLRPQPHTFPPGVYPTAASGFFLHLDSFLLLDFQWAVGWEAGDLPLYSEVETHFCFPSVGASQGVGLGGLRTPWAQRAGACVGELM